MTTANARDSRATLRDVADAAGVSVSTASRVIRNTRNVDQELRDRVLKAAEALGYRADPLARALRGGASGTIGCIVPRITNPFFPALVETLERELARDGQHLILAQSYDDIDLERHLVERLIERRTDGLVIVPSNERRSAPTIEVAATHVRTVQVDRFASRSTAFVGVDNDAGVQQAIAHLAASGRHRLAFIGGEPETSASHERYEAFKKHAGERQVAAEPVGGFLSEWGEEAVKRIWDAGTRPDAVVCAADVIAIGALSAFRQLGVAVPDEVAIIGFDGIGAGAITHPSLTTVAQPFAEIARVSVACLNAEPDGTGTRKTRTVVAPLLIPREST